MARHPARSISLLLVALLLVNVAPAVSSTGAAGPDPVASNARIGATYMTIQAALNAAAAGDTITVVNSSATPAAAYAEDLTIATNGVTLCATLALNVCADHVAPGRWDPQSKMTFADPPVPFQGQALKGSGSATSTSFYPNSNNPTSTAPKFHVADIHALSFDMMIESGASCGGGSPRMQFGVDTNGDGAKDDADTLSVYLTPSGYCPAPNTWVHVDLMQTGRWQFSYNGGGNTLASAVTKYADKTVVTMNLIWDASTGTAWFDNERLNDHVLRESTDMTCLDPESASCSTDAALGKTILDGAITITGADVTVTGFTLKNTDVADQAHPTAAITTTATATGARILGNDIQGNGVRPVQSARDSPEFGVVLRGADFLVANNTIANWAHTGVYVSSGPGKIADNAVNQNRANALYLEDSGPAIQIDRNDLTQATGANIRVDGRGFTARDNVLGVSQYTIDFYSSPAPTIDAERNHWGAYTRDDILATIHEDAPGHVVDIDCYYDLDGVTTICPPTAGFTFSPNAPHINAGVAFTDASTPGGRSIASRSWTFGDGATSTASSPTHAYARSGVFTVTQTVTDSEGASSSNSRTVSVSNTAPVLASLAPRTVAEGSFLQVIATATDADGDALTYSATGLPAGASFTPATRKFAWTPTFAQAGTYTVTIRATDGDMTAETPLEVTVTNVDRAPTLGAITNKNVLEGATLSWNAVASDADGDAIVLTTSALPAWLSFVDGGAGTGAFTAAPLAGDHGAYTVTVTATSGALTASRTFTITVAANAGLSLTIVGTSTPHLAPGATTLTARVANTGPTEDSFSFVATAGSGWTVTAPASVTLAPGTNTTVTLSVTAPATSSRTSIRLTATSALNAATARAVTWTADVPVTITMDVQSASLTGGVHVLVHAEFVDHTPLVGAQIRLAQAPTTFGGAFETSLLGTTDAVGNIVFAFENDVRATLPDTHDLSATLLTGAPVVARGSYDVDLN